MEKILFIDACVREESRTRELAEHLLLKIGEAASRLSLYEEPVRPLGAEDMRKRAMAAEAGDYSDEYFRYAKQFAEADKIVVAAPYWDLLFPAVLREYFEAVSVSGITFRYSEKGAPIGLCKAKRIYYVTTAGGFIGEDNHGFNYVKALSEKLYGIESALFFSAEGLDIAPERAADIMKSSKERIDLYRES